MQDKATLLKHFSYTRQTQSASQKHCHATKLNNSITWINKRKKNSCLGLCSGQVDELHQYLVHVRPSRTEGSPGSKRVLLGRWCWRPGERMIDEDVRPQIDRQISGSLYLLLWCNQSHSFSLCLSLSPSPLFEGWLCYLSLRVQDNRDGQPHMVRAVLLSPLFGCLYPYLYVLL